MDDHVLSVLIVDDEILIRQELQMFDWESRGSVLVGEASNGEEALAFCRKYVPDVIITDITMPVMNGLALIRTLKKEFPQIQVVILSCHSDFEYAREALKLGAIGYVVKVMMDDSELEQALVEARRSIEKEKSYSTKKKEEDRWNQSKLLGQLLNHNDSTMLLYTSLADNGLPIVFPLQIVRFYVEAKHGDWLFVDREVRHVLGSYDQDFAWVPVDIGEHFVYFGHQSKDRMPIMQTIEAVISDMHHRLKSIHLHKPECIHIYASISDDVEKPEQFNQAFQEMNLWKNDYFYNSSNRVFLGKPEGTHAIEPKALAVIEEKMKKVIWNQAGLSTFIEGDFLNWAREHRIMPNELKKLVHKWHVLWNEELGDSNDDVILSQHTYQTVTLDEMIAALIHDIYINFGKENKYRPEIRLVMKIIREKISQPLSLSSVAEQVGFSSPYLSRLFSEEVGESFNDYVTRLRMEKAAFLLKNMNLKVYEVAEQVGIPSYRYFSIVFRNWMGVTPLEFKKG
ncbi:response regulator [Paenibacillus qinlingensis]|uniref:response regulator n=1 Tax=Paenibacillus qinlingensis TaxID=1837343 RepID=UPI0015631818|nr:response regulator [Paenibacillus qinlingensis]NQX60026.1 response regulator [Paenibacillus qinlingensis]